MSPGSGPAAAWRRGLGVVVPFAVPLAMKAVFTAATRRLGPERGYQAGFAVYWVTCWVLAGAVVGPRRLAALWQPSGEPVPAPRALGWPVLVLPPLGGFATEWLPNVRGAGPVAVGVAAWVGTTNAVAEEALWRGLPVAIFPDDPVRGWLLPAAGFTAWHLVPLTTRPTSARRRAAVLLGAAAIGLGYGWVAHRTRSLATVSAAHALTDSCGVRPARTIWLGRGD
jgi:membrane protease YdiL (CAAX protease family)